MASYYFVSEGLVVKLKQYNADGVLENTWNIEKSRFVNILANGDNVDITLSPVGMDSLSGVSGAYVGNSITGLPYDSIYIASSVQGSAATAATNLRTLVNVTVTVS